MACARSGHRGPPLLTSAHHCDHCQPLPRCRQRLSESHASLPPQFAPRPCRWLLADSPPRALRVLIPFSVVGTVIIAVAAPEAGSLLLDSLDPLVLALARCRGTGIAVADSGATRESGVRACVALALWLLVLLLVVPLYAMEQQGWTCAPPLPASGQTHALALVVDKYLYTSISAPRVQAPLEFEGPPSPRYSFPPPLAQQMRSRRFGATHRNGSPL